MTVSARKEFWGGLTTFLTMSYIVVVNPAILATEGTGMSFSGVMTATVLLCFSMTLLMGLFANLPYAVAPGLGVNAFFTFSVVLGKGVPWPIALGIVFWAGVLFLLCSVFELRERIVAAIPHHLRVALASGLGLFLTFIGFQNMGLIVADPHTLVKMGPLTPELGLSLLGLAIILFFYFRRSPLTFIAGIMTSTLLAWTFGLKSLPSQWLMAPDFNSMLFKLDIWGALQLALLPTILSIFFTDLFDSLATFVGVSQSSGMLDKAGKPRNLKQGLMVDAMATLTAGIFGTSSGTAYMESVAGIEAGARTGRASVVTAFCFLPLLFLSPLAEAIPHYATGPVLVVVGFVMFSSIAKLSFKKIEEFFPAFITLTLIPLSFSITQGILWGLLAHTFLFVIVGRRKDLTGVSYVLAILAIGLLILEGRP